MPDDNRLAAGRLLIAPPSLDDPHFRRTVVFLCDYDDTGAFGLVLNRPLHLNASDLIQGFEEADLALRYGGPVQPDTLHMLHTEPGLLKGGDEVLPGVFWGGPYRELPELAALGLVSDATLRLFLGYSGWAAGQLEQEMSEDAWVLADARPEDLFDTPPDALWASVLRRLGEPYAYLALFPENPSLN